jgi:hypothetical protein
MPSDEESIGRSTYEGLVRLTFLCGRGLEPEELVRRFLVAMRDSVPAQGMWLFQSGRLIACDHEPGLRQPKVPESLPPGLGPQVDGDLIWVAVLPEMMLGCRVAAGSVQRAADVVTLVGRIIALAWQAEMVSRDEVWDDDYLAAKSTFKRRWLRTLLKRNGGVVSSAARAAGLSRGTFYAMMDQVGARECSGDAAAMAAGEVGADPDPAPGTVRLKRKPKPT